MIKTLEKNYRYIELLLTVLLFGLAVSYDSIHFPRAYIFVSGFAGFGLLIVLRIGANSHNAVRASYVASVLIVLFLEFNSRYIINYFIHILYILLIVELAVTLTRLPDLWIGAVVVVTGMYKYVALIQYKPAISTYAEAAFFLLLNLMSILVITLMQGLREEKRKLISANSKLESYSKEVEMLTEIKTRADIASKIHDGVGHNLTALIMQLEMTSHLLDMNPEMAKGYLDAAKETARDNLVKVRQAVKTMDQAAGAYDIDTLIRQFSNNTGVKISWEIDHDILGDRDVKECIYRAVQEAMTNALRHGQASQMDIQLSLVSNDIHLVVKDNGQINALPDLGYGLTKMTERFKALSGHVEFEMDDGLILRAVIPYETGGHEIDD